MATKLNYSVSLDGSSDAFSHADHADFKPTGNFTVGAWFKTTSTGSYKYIFQNYVATAVPRNESGWEIYITSGNKARFLVAKNTGTATPDDYTFVTSDTTVTDGIWHFMVGVWDGTYIKLYIDGVQEGGNVSAYNVAYSASNYTNVGCSYYDGANSGFFPGNLKNVFLINGTALTQAEVATKMFQDLVGTTNLKALYKFENNNDDSSGQGHDLTDIGTPTYVNTPEDVPHTWYLESEDNLTSMKFDGSNDALSITDHADLKPTGNFTVGAWIKGAAGGGSQDVIFNSFSYSNPGFAGIVFMTFTSDQIRLVSGRNNGNDSAGTGYQAVNGSTNVRDSRWHFVVGTWDGSYLRVYVDGIEDASPVAWANAPAYGASNNVRVGCQSNDGSNLAFFEGNQKGTFLINGTAWDATKIKSYLGAKILTTETNLKLLLPLDGVLTDASGNSHNASLVDLPYYSPNVPFDARGARQSMLLNGSTQAVSIVDHADLKPTGAFTVGAWIKTASGSAKHIINSFSYEASKYSGFRLFINASHHLHFEVGDKTGSGGGNVGQIDGATTIDDGAWHFCVGTYDGSYVRIYVDGTSDADAVAWANGVAYETTNFVFIGTYREGATYYSWFSGKMRGVFLINGTAWDSTKITSYLTKNIENTETNLKLRMDLDNNYIDKSGNGHHGTPIATPTFTSIVPYDGVITDVDVDDERSAKITGKVSTSSERGAKLTGAGTVDERSAKITGKVETNSERGAKILGGLETNSERGAKIHGGSSTSSERSSKVTGQLSTSSERGARLTGKQTVAISRTYRILVKDENDNFIGEFDKFDELKFGKRLNNYGTASFKIPANDSKASSLISLRKYTVWIYYEKNSISTLVWSGEQAMREAELKDSNNNWCTIHCYDWLEMFSSRYTANEKIFTNTDAGQIAMTLIDETQALTNGDFGIIEGDIEVTVDRDRTYHNDNIMESIINLSAVLSGFDFEITNDKIFNVYNLKGEDKTETVILEYGVNMTEAQIIEDFTSPVNKAIVLGQSTDDLEDLVRVERNDTDLQLENKIREDVLSEMDVSDTITMESKGDALIRKYGTSLFKIDIDLLKSTNISLLDFSLGDLIRLIIKYGIYDIDEGYRIFEWAVEFDNNNAEKINLILGKFTI